MYSAPVILAVEDEALIRMDVVDQLEAKGYEVFEAANASEAMSVLSGNLSINVVFTDVDMPGEMNGLMLAAVIRSRWPPIGIIVTSGHRAVDVGDLPKGSRFFPKPYQCDAIASAIEEMAS